MEFLNQAKNKAQSAIATAQTGIQTAMTSVNNQIQAARGGKGGGEGGLGGWEINTNGLNYTDSSDAGRIDISAYVGSIASFQPKVVGEKELLVEVKYTDSEMKWISIKIASGPLTAKDLVVSCPSDTLFIKSSGPTC